MQQRKNLPKTNFVSLYLRVDETSDLPFSVVIFFLIGYGCLKTTQFLNLLSVLVCMLFDRNAIVLVQLLYYRKSCSFIKIAIISTQIGAQLLIIHMKTLPFTFNNDQRKHC